MRADPKALTATRAIAEALLAGARHSRNAYEAAAFEYCRDALGVLHRALADSEVSKIMNAYGMASASYALCVAPTDYAGSASLRYTSMLARALMDVCLTRYDDAIERANVAHAMRLAA